MDYTSYPELDQFREEWMEKLRVDNKDQSSQAVTEVDRPSTTPRPETGAQDQTTYDTASADQQLAAEPTSPTSIASDPPEWIKESQIKHDLRQDLATGSLTVRPATILDPVRKSELPPRRIRQAWKKGKTAPIYSRQPGKPDRYLNTLPVDAARAFSTVLDDAVTHSGLPSHRVNKFVIPVTCDDQAEALATSLAWQKEIVDSKNCGMIPFKRITELPVYRYYRMAQIFRATGMDDKRREMLQRIENMKYEAQWYHPAIDDVKNVIRFMDPENDIRKVVISSIARAWLDRSLGGRKDIDMLWSENEEFRNEVDPVVKRLTAARSVTVHEDE
ncbi:hypothetical protein OHC33_000934 [Knufia fluminis]|uniref:Uncharacterized protein n=1 Tax=Knufia fluminis TaxID=191047 RepID=A0AAN8ENQ2_9EURO|nr:hypothetical protein OHC33_000934 [Knufia fluminis]